MSPYSLQEIPQARQPTLDTDPLLAPLLQACPSLDAEEAGRLILVMETNAFPTGLYAATGKAEWTDILS